MCVHTSLRLPFETNRIHLEQKVRCGDCEKGTSVCNSGLQAASKAHRRDYVCEQTINSAGADARFSNTPDLMAALGLGLPNLSSVCSPLVNDITNDPYLLAS